jgi:hypothetical protein
MIFFFFRFLCGDDEANGRRRASGCCFFLLKKRRRNKECFFYLGQRRLKVCGELFFERNHIQLDAKPANINQTHNQRVEDKDRDRVDFFEK